MSRHGDVDIDDYKKGGERCYPDTRKYYCPQCGKKEAVDMERMFSHTPHLAGCLKCEEPFYLPMGGPDQRKQLLKKATHNDVYWIKDSKER